MKNMNCEQIKPWLIDFVDGNLDLENCAGVHEHLKSCESCNQDLEEIKTLFKELNTVRDESPPASIKEEFRQMLDKEMAKSETNLRVIDAGETGNIRVTPNITRSWWLQVAAAVILLAAGALIDRLVFSEKPQTRGPGIAMTELQNEMDDLADILVTRLAGGSSPSERIRTIDSVRFVENPDPEIIGILFTALNRDQNVNVRFAAAQTLSLYIKDEQIRTGFIESLAIQNEPLIQITLLNFLVGMGETRAVYVIKQLLYNPENPDIVREEASKGITILES